MREDVFLDGANTVSRMVGFQGHVGVMGIQFHEGGAFPLLGIPLHELQKNMLSVATACLGRLNLRGYFCCQQKYVYIFEE